MDVSKISKDKQYGIREAAAITDTSEVFLRQLIRKGTIATKLIQVGDTKIQKHMIPGTALLEYGAKRGQRTTRTDGRNKYTLYATKAEIEAVRKQFPELPLGMTNAGVYEKRKAAAKAKETVTK